MLQLFFVAPKTLKRLRSGPSGPHIDSFAAELERQGYSHSTSKAVNRHVALTNPPLAAQGFQPMVLDAFFFHGG